MRLATTRIVLTLLLACPSTGAGQEAILPDPGRVSSVALVPHRLRLDLGESLSDVFNTPQVYISLERTTYYDAGEPRQALRVRWVANTHAHEDEVLVDAERFSVVQVETLGVSIQDPARIMAFVRGDSITSVRLNHEGATASSTVWWGSEPAFHLMMLPYWFASIDPRPNERYLLPQFSAGTGTRSVIEVDVMGRLDTGEWHFRSEHGWVMIDWYVDRQNAPYLTRMVWHYRGGRRDGQVSESRVVDWAIFEGDVFRGVVR